MTRDIGIALVASLARANRFVVPHMANGVGAAIAGIATLPVDAGLAIAAIVVCRARSDDR